MTILNKVFQGDEQERMPACPLCGREQYLSYQNARLDNAQLSRLVNAYLAKLCICPSLSGFDYIHFSILYCMDHPKALHQVTTTLYPIIGETFHTSAQCVERSMRYALRQAWKVQCGELHTLMDAYQCGGSCPGNGKFLAAVVQKLQVDYML